MTAAKLPVAERREKPASACPEFALWRNVIFRAIQDCFQVVDGAQAEKEFAQKAALSWVLRDTEDFAEVCAMADLEPEETRAAIKDLLTQAVLNPQAVYSAESAAIGRNAKKENVRAAIAEALGMTMEKAA